MKKKVLVSGGSRGIGRAIALRLAESWEVHSFARGPITDGLDHPLAKKVTHQTGIDVENLTQLEALPLQQYDALVNNVGTAYDGILATQSVESMQRILNVNLLSVCSLTKFFLRARLAGGMGGSIVNISSIVGSRGYSGLAVYSATKAGIDGLTRALAREMGSKGFRINAVLPGYVETELSKGLDAEQKEQIIRRTPLGRLATAREIADAVEFFVSEKSAFITGECLTVDGGISV